MIISYMKKLSFLSIILLLFIGCQSEKEKEQNFSPEDYGIIADSGEDTSPGFAKLIKDLKNRESDQSITIRLPKGRYDFYEEEATVREYYISNHDQDNPKKVGIALEDLKNITLDGQGSEFIFHGRMIPVSILNAENIHLKNFSIDFELPAFRQLNILEVNKDAKEIIAEIHPENNYRIDDGKLIALGEGYETTPTTSMAFHENKRLTYQRGDVEFNPESVEEISPGKLKIKGWHQVDHTSPGERFALRTYYRPTPGIFISESKNTQLNEITVHNAEGMGLLAQLCENITLDGFSVALKGDDDPRYYTTQADATHFSSCKGKIISKNGLYEGMADDAINVHGTYLRITDIKDDHTLQASYMHDQTWGFPWGFEEDEVQFIQSDKMQTVSNESNYIRSIKPVDTDSIKGAKKFEITLKNPLPKELKEEGKYAIENLTWTPEVEFSNNRIRHNRARGTLFSTPQKVVVEDNVFDHTHGAAILLAGDANGWFETGPSKDVLIRRNRFINALTANYQFTNAIISIYPEIPDLENQEKFYHSNIVIEENVFETFDTPILYAKSVDGLTFRKNKILHNEDYKPFHWNNYVFYFEKMKNVRIEDNEFDKDFNPETDIKIELSADDALKLNNNTSKQ